MSEKTQWVKVPTFVEVNTEKFDISPHEELVRAIKAGQGVFSPEKAYPSVFPPEEDAVALPSEGSDKEMAGLLLTNLENVNSLLKRSHAPEMLPDHREAFCDVCRATTEADQAIVKAKRILQTRIDQEYDLDEGWGMILK